MTDQLKAKTGRHQVKFGDVVRLSKVRSQDPLADDFERYVGLEHLEPGDLHIRNWGNVADGVTFTNVCQPGQVLFGKRRAYQRKVAVADFSGVCSGDIYVLEAGKAHRQVSARLKRRYARLFLNTSCMRMRNFSRGRTATSVSIINGIGTRGSSATDRLKWQLRFFKGNCYDDIPIEIIYNRQSRHFSIGN